MEAKETLFKTDIGLTLAQDEDFFRNIFKKTEKIACAVFYITRSTKDTEHIDTVVARVEDTAERLIGVSIHALGALHHERMSAIRALRYTHIELESRLRVMSAAQLLPREHLEVFLSEIDSVQRSLNKFMTSSNEQLSFSSATPQMMLVTERKRSSERLVGQKEKRLHSEGEKVQGMDRRDRVLAVLRDKGEATIKDISSVITDCSEKTIQRELTALIKDSQIVREGERRWSKYSLVK